MTEIANVKIDESTSLIYFRHTEQAPWYMLAFLRLSE